MTSPPASASYRFGGFELQPDRRRLLADGRPQPPGHRASDVVARAGGIATRRLTQMPRGARSSAAPRAGGRPPAG